MKRRLDETIDDIERRPKMDDERLQRFERWLDEENVIRENVLIRQSTIGKGYALYKDSSKNLPKIEIPTSLFISIDAAKLSSTFVVPSEEILEKTDDHIDRETLILSLFLLDERSKGSESHWFPYIDLLPAKFASPLFHKENLVELTPAFHLGETMKHSMNEICHLIDLKSLSMEDFLWAYTVVGSRAFKLNDFGTVLIPFADLANHVSLKNDANLRSSGVNAQTNRFILLPIEENLNEDEELNLQYNELANWQLLLNYGFAIEKNPFDSLLVEFQIDPNDSKEIEMKKLFLMNFCKKETIRFPIEKIFHLGDGLSLEHELKICDDEEILSDELIGSLRLIVMTNDELEQFSVSNIDEILSNPINNDNERRALIKLKTHLDQIKEKTFTTSLEENRQRLKSTNLTDDERYALIYLVGQKEIFERIFFSIDKIFSQLE